MTDSPKININTDMTNVVIPPPPKKNTRLGKRLWRKVLPKTIEHFKLYVENSSNFYWCVGGAVGVQNLALTYGAGVSR